MPQTLPLERFQSWFLLLFYSSSKLVPKENSSDFTTDVLPVILKYYLPSMAHTFIINILLIMRKVNRIWIFLLYTKLNIIFLANSYYQPNLSLGIFSFIVIIVNFWLFFYISSQSYNINGASIVYYTFLCSWKYSIEYKISTLFDHH